MTSGDSVEWKKADPFMVFILNTNKFRMSTKTFKMNNVDIFFCCAFFAFMAIIPSAEMLRAARALLGWNQRQLAAAAGVSRPTVHKLETRGIIRGENARDSGDNATLESVEAIVRAYEAQGIEFIESTSSTGAGVRWRTPAGRTGEDPSEEAVEKKL
ncbi:helix-turn-helix transcriptional regulator [Shinella sp.]|uniref:helix-turn-helix domain-containing protein n=1 Tax=Shinella sp. TaxID=1870904 RepID=UPI0028A09834|nr:helix-turn-helix transcriptional regulator [Shinella sp.]